jgi:hypothetical protein
MSGAAHFPVRFQVTPAQGLYNIQLFGKKLEPCFSRFLDLHRASSHARADGFRIGLVADDLPIVIVDPTALTHLREAEGSLDAIETILAIPIADIVRPPSTVRVYRRIEGRMQLTEVPGPSPREAAQNHAAVLSDLLAGVDQALTDAKVTARYKVYSWGCWGTEPDFRPVLRPLPDDFNDRLYHQLRRRFRTRRREVRNRQQCLIKTLPVIDRTRIGQVFHFRDCGIRRNHRICRLAKEPNPVISRHSRDAIGTLWERLR